LEPHYVYRYFNDAAPESDRLLYIGMTRNPKKRDQIHRSSSRWYGDVTRREVVEYPDEMTASGVEFRAIGDEAPVYNVQGNHKRYAAAMAQLAERAANLDRAQRRAS
jgi:hypothetical protein